MPTPDRRIQRLMPSAVEGFRAQRITQYIDTGNELSVSFELGRVTSVSPLNIAWPDVRIVPAQSRVTAGAEYEELFAAEEAAGRLIDGRVRIPQALAFFDARGWFPWLT